MDGGLGPPSVLRRWHLLVLRSSGPGSQIWERLFPGCCVSAVLTLPWVTVFPGVGPEQAAQAHGHWGRWTKGPFSP